tara:strand:+ start:13 stop:126 length:114 start_codon:yes stop_codon:yes gene_type:complete
MKGRLLNVGVQILTNGYLDKYCASVDTELGDDVGLLD